jgi:hypothetical protein
MQHSNHAQAIASRFRQLVEDAGDSLPAEHYDELALLIEAGIDTAVVERLDNMAAQLERLAKDIRRDAERYG